MESAVERFLKAYLLLCILTLFSTFSAVAHATAYDGINISTATDYKTYQNLGTAGHSAGLLNITNITEFSQTMLVTSNVNGSFSYPGQTALDIFYVLNPFKLNEYYNASAPSANTVHSPPNHPSSSAWTIINITYKGPGGAALFARAPLRIFVTGYTNNSISYNGFAPYPSTYSNALSSNTGTLLIPHLYNVTDIYFNRTVMGAINVTIWDTSVNAPSNSVELAALTNVTGGYILYGPDSESQNYYPIDPANMPVQYDNTGGHSLANFTLAQTNTANMQGTLNPYQYYTYSMNAMVSNTPDASFSFGIVNLSLASWEGPAPMSINYTANFGSNVVGTQNEVTYTAPNGMVQQVSAGFADAAGNQANTIGVRKLQFNMAEQDMYVPPKSATLTAQPSPASANSAIWLNATVTYGQQPYSYKYQIYATANSQLVAGQQYNGISSTSNTFIWHPATSGNYYANVIVTDADANSITSAPTGNIVITGYSAMSPPAISASPTVVTVNGPVTFSANVVGGSNPYTYNFLVYNAVSNALAGSQLYANVYSSSNSYVWYPSNTGTFYAQATITDYTGNAITSPDSKNVIVEPRLLPTLSISQTSADAGEPITLSAAINAGTPPYSYDYRVVNFATNAIVANIVYKSSLATNALTWTIPVSQGGNTLAANVTVTDNNGLVGNSTRIPSVGVVDTIPVGSSQPSDLGISPSGNIVYVANYYGLATVNVIDTQTNTVINNFNPPDQITSPIIFNPSGTMAYGADQFGDIVEVINVASNSVTNTISAGTTPYRIALSPSGSILYATDYGSNSISVIDTATNTMLYAINLGPGSAPEGIAVNPAGTFAYVAESGKNMVGVVNLATNAISTISIGNAPDAVTVNPSGTTVYATNYNDGTISVINASTNTVTNTLTGLPDAFGVTFSPSGQLAYIANEEKVIYVLNTVTNALIAQIPVASSTFTMTNFVINPSGTVGYVAQGPNGSPGTVNVISAIPYLTVNRQVTAGAITPSSPTISSGQSVTMNAFPSGGVAPYTYAWYSTASGATAATQCGSGSWANSGASSATYSPSPTSGTYYCYTVTDNAPVPETAYSANDFVTVTASTTSVTTVPSSGGSGGGGGGSSSGGGGPQKPTIAYADDGYLVYGIAQLNSFSIMLGDQNIHAVDNFLSPTDTGILINNVSYTLAPGQPARIAGINCQCYVELTGISYLPILKTVSLYFYMANSTAQAIGNATQINVSASSQFPARLNFSDFKAEIVVNTNRQSFTNMLMHVANYTSTTPAVPSGYVRLESIDITATPDNFSYIDVSLNYGCAYKDSSIAAFMLTNGTWVAIRNATNTPSECTLSFPIYSDPVVGIFAQSTPSTSLPSSSVSTVTTAATSTAPQSTTTVPPRQGASSSAILYYLTAAAIIIAIATCAWWARRRNGFGRP